jgi:8-oxo-dGTP pyrophosphatase MutT (NUDIX family)
MKQSSKLILAQGKRVLLLQRAKDRLWTLPGGKRKGSEKPRQCLLREVAEEIPHVRLKQIRRLQHFQWSTTKGKRTRQIIYQAMYAGGSLEIGDTSELVKAEWREPNQSRLAPAAELVTRKLLGSSE